jgi:pentatricopeptide repeat protein
MLGENSFIASALISMYAKCGMISKAWNVLEELTFRDVVSWSTLISSYSQHGQAHEALICFEQMQNEGISPDVVTYSCVLKACGHIGSLHEGERFHKEIMDKGLLERNIILGNILVDMYSNCGAIEKAHKALLDLSIRDVVSWSTLIAGYAECGRYVEALTCFDQMLNENICPNSVTFASMLKICGSIENVEKGMQIHEEITTMGLLRKDVILGNALVDMYSKCGVFEKAQKVLSELPIRSTQSWNALIAGYAQKGRCFEALNCLKQMKRAGFSPNSFTYVCLVKACGNSGAIEKGKLIHAESSTKGLVDKNVTLGNALIGMYAKCGMLGKAKDVLEELPTQDVLSWSALISGYVHQGKCHEAISCFKQMQIHGVSPDVVTFVCILKACGEKGAIDEGNVIHNDIVNNGFLAKHIALGTALVDMYAKCGVLGKAQQVLEGLNVRNETTWNSLIAGYADHGQFHIALNCFEQMQRERHHPSIITYTCILKACGCIGAVDKGKQIHDEISSKGLLDKDIVLGNALVDMYAKCGFLLKAQEVLEEIHVQDVVSWNALLSGFIQQGLCCEALICFEKMENMGFSPDNVTLICMLKSCGCIGAINTGKQIHDTILTRGLLDKDIGLGGALVDMYAKCGKFVMAQSVFDGLHVRNVVSWSSLIAGYARQGRSYEALECFERMQSEGLYPNSVTFVCILYACCRIGLWDESNSFFESMTRNYGISPNAEHHNCLVSFLGFTGHFDKAMSLIEMMPSCDYDALWLALLAACRKWGNMELASLVFDQAVRLKNGYGSACVLRAGDCADLGTQRKEERIEPLSLKLTALEKQVKCGFFNIR